MSIPKISELELGGTWGSWKGRFKSIISSKPAVQLRADAADQPVTEAGQRTERDGWPGLHSIASPASVLRRLRFGLGPTF
jgi:hypothetical protein